MCSIDEHDINNVLVYVTSKACADCPLAHGQHPAIRTELAEMVQQGRHTQQTLECITVTIGERLGYAIPEYSVCYAFFYLYAHENEVLKRAVDEGRIRYLDVSDWPRLADTHFNFYGPSYITYQHYDRRNTYPNPTVPKEIQE